MKHMKQIVMVVALIALAFVGYKAYQRYYAPQAEDVKVQFLNFGGNYDGDGWNGHNNSWQAGYNAGMANAQNN